MKKLLSRKRVLVTAGSTWVPIDRVRVITNIFTGRTGCAIAQKARDMGAQVKLLIGVGNPGLPLRGVRVIKYSYFDDLLKLMKKELLSGKYDIIIHSAAVSDYIPVKPRYGKKIPSGSKVLTIKLKPALKIIKQIKKWDPDIFLAQFKLEVGKKLNELIKTGYQSMVKNASDLVVVNDLNKMNKNKHEAYIMDRAKKIKKVATRESLASNLLKTIAVKITKPSL